MSVKDGKADKAERGVPAWGGTKVRVAKRNCTTVSTVGGSWRRIMRMARTSRRGQDERMVVATVSMFGVKAGGVLFPGAGERSSELEGAESSQGRQASRPSSETSELARARSSSALETAAWGIVAESVGAAAVAEEEDEDEEASGRLEGLVWCDGAGVSGERFW